MITLASPMGTGPVRWAIATSMDVVDQLQLLGDALHLELGHLGVGVVLEVGHRAPARVVARGADERRDRAGVGAGNLGDDRGEVERLGLHLEVAAGHRRDHRDLVAVGQRLDAAPRTRGFGHR